jgi:hypothetical protein
MSSSDNPNGIRQCSAANVVATEQIETQLFSATLFEMRICEELAKARDMRNFIEIISVLIRRYGFTDFSFVRMSREEEYDISLKTFADIIPEFYTKEGIWGHDLMLQYAAQNEIPICQTTIDGWVDIAEIETETIAQNRKLQRFIKGLGFLEHYSVPLKASNACGKILFTVTAHNESAKRIQAKARRSQYELGVLARAIDYFGTLKFPNFFLDSDESRSIVIAPRSLDLLAKLATKDMTLEALAEHEEISYRTAKSEISRVKTALNVKTLGRAILVAIEKGLIE